MRCNKARQEIIWERHHGAGSVVPFSLQAGNDIFFRFYLTKAELLALTLADFSIEEKTLSITKSFQRIGGRDVITEPKTAKGKRVITLPDFLVMELEAYTEKLYSHASLLISKLGAQPNLVADRLGHEKIQTTLSTYSHLYPNQARNLAEQLNGLVDDEEGVY